MKENEDAVFICRSSTKPSWLFSNGPLPANSYQVETDENFSLYIRKVNIFSQGSYICSGTTEFYDRFKARSQLFVRGDYITISVSVIEMKIPLQYETFICDVFMFANTNY